MVMALRAMFVCVFLSMVAVTFAASLDRNIWAAAVELWLDLWFRAVLLDAYFGFFTIWLWIAYREVRVGRRCFWFILLMCFGNIAIAAYMLRVLYQIDASDSASHIFLRPKIS